MGSSSAGVSVVGFGVTAGTSWRDGDCVRRLNARELANTIGDRDAAKEVMCGDWTVFRAYNAVGRPCHMRPDGKPNPEFVSTSAVRPPAYEYPPLRPNYPTPFEPEAQRTAPEAPKVFAILFPYREATLTADAQKTCQEAALHIRRGDPTTIRIVGTTDGSGDESVDRALAERRSRAVAAFLAANGVNVSAAQINGVEKADLDPHIGTG